MITYADPSVLYLDPDFLWNGDETPEVLLRIGNRDLDYVGGTLRLRNTVDSLCTARLTIESDTELLLEEGEQVLLRLRKKRAFAGLLRHPVETWPGHVNRLYQIEGVCFTQLAHRRIISKSYLNTTVRDIVADIVNDDLGADGVTVGSVDEGPNVTEAVFAYVSAAFALNRLAELSGFHWHIDELKRLDMGPVTAFPAPFDLDDLDEFADSAEKADSNRDYRNRQYVRGGRAETEPRVETYVGDGARITFVTGFPIARQPTITLNTVPQTVAVRGIGDSGSQWFWSRASTEVSQNELDTVLGSGDTLEITYKGLFSIVVVSTNQGEVDRKKALEGFGSGLSDAVDTDVSLSTSTAAFEFASG
ncbi:hypothetical protein LCGC14_2362310, partial [marine sediment metagenome]